MLRKSLFIIVLAILAVSCTTMQQPTAYDELYESPKVTQNQIGGEPVGDYFAQEQQIDEQFVDDVTSLLEENEKVDTVLYENKQVSANPYDEVLVDDFSEAWERRREGRMNPWYGMNNYYMYRNSDAFWYASAYDPAFYTVVVMGDEVWVEPNYIAASFGYRNSFYGNYWYTGFGGAYGYPYYSNWYNAPYGYNMGYMHGYYGGLYGGYPAYWYGREYYNLNRPHGVQRRVGREVFIGGNRQLAQGINQRPIGIGSPEGGVVVKRPQYDRGVLVAGENAVRTVKRDDGSRERIYVRPHSSSIRRSVGDYNRRSTYRTSGAAPRVIDRSRTVSRYQRPATDKRSVQVRRPSYVHDRVDRSSYSDSRNVSRSRSNSSSRSSSVTRNSSSGRSSATRSSSGSKSTRRSVGTKRR